MYPPKQQALYFFLFFFLWVSSQASRVHLPEHVKLSYSTTTKAGEYQTGEEEDLISLQPDGKLLTEIRDRGIRWLMSQRSEEFGWPAGDTARVVVALASQLEDWPHKNDLVARLIIKQLEIELLEKLLRREVDPLTPAKVAVYALSLSAACRDPHNFYGHNLVASLEKHHSHQDFPGYPEAFGYTFTSLVSCLAGSHVHKQRTKHLLQISKGDPSKPYSIDTRGVALLALECVRHKKKGGDVLSSHMHQPLEALAKLQQTDGSFGNIHSTAIAIQALAGKIHVDSKWNKTAAAEALSSFQEPNGSFLNNIYATTESVVAASTLLNGLGLLGLRRGHCNSIRRRNESIDNNNNNLISSYYFPDAQQQETTTTTEPVEVTSPTPTPKPEIVQIRYWLWIGPSPPSAKKYNITLSVPLNSTFFSVMQRAAETSQEFEFSTTVWPNGHYIHTIASQHEQPVGYHYWLLYLLNEDPDPEHPPSSPSVAPAGVDDLRVKNGQVYLFWFKKI